MNWNNSCAKNNALLRVQVTSLKLFMRAFKPGPRATHSHFVIHMLEINDFKNDAHVHVPLGG